MGAGGGGQPVRSARQGRALCAVKSSHARPTGGALLRASRDRYQDSGVRLGAEHSKGCPSHPTTELGFPSVNEGRPVSSFFPRNSENDLEDLKVFVMCHFHRL